MRESKRKERKEGSSLTVDHDISKNLRGTQAHTLVPELTYFAGISLHFPFYFVFKEYVQVSIRCVKYPRKAN